MSEPTHLLDIRQAADFLRVSEKTVRRLIARGELTASQIGNRWRIRRRDLDAMLDEAANSRPRRRA